MADYAPTVWVDEETKVGPTNLNKLEAGVADAAGHHYTGRTADRPPADAAHKHHIFRSLETGAAEYCTGSEWIPLSRGAAAPANYTERANLAAPGGFPPPPADSVVPTSPEYRSQRITPTVTGPVNVVMLRLGRSAALTAGEVQVAVFPDDGTGKPAQDELAWFGSVKATAIAAAMGEYAFVLRPTLDNIRDNIQAEAGVPLHVAVLAAGVTGGNVLVDTSSASGGAFTRAFYGQPWDALTNDIGGIRLLDDPTGFIVGAGGGYGDAFRVQDSIGNRLLRVAGDGSIYGPNERKIAHADGTSDFSRAPQVSALPSNPAHGDEVWFQNQSMMNNGVGWRLRYRAYNLDGTANTNTHKWEYVGGAVFYARDAAAIGLGVANSYVGPEHSVPLAGWYEVTTAFNAYNAGTGAGIVQAGHYDASNVVLEASSENFVQGYLPGTTSGRVQIARTALFSVVLVAGSTIRLGYNSEVASGHTARFRSLGLKPVRVG